PPDLEGRAGRASLAHRLGGQGADAEQGARGLRTVRERRGTHSLLLPQPVRPARRTGRKARGRGDFEGRGTRGRPDARAPTEAHRGLGRIAPGITPSAAPAPAPRPPRPTWRAPPARPRRARSPRSPRCRPPQGGPGRPR